jgi:hypothetical protein
MESTIILHSQTEYECQHKGHIGEKILKPAEQVVLSTSRKSGFHKQKDFDLCTETS